MAIKAKKWISTAVTSVVLLFAACSTNTCYEKYEPVDALTWDMNKSLHFEVNMADTVNHYNVLLHIRHTNQYPYQNLWLFTHSMAPDSTVACDTLECFLANNHGEWLGNACISEYEMPLLYMNGIKFPKAGVYTFDIAHGMRDSLLLGVKNIGLSVELITPQEYVKE